MTQEQVIEIMADAAGPNVSKAAMNRAFEAMWAAIAEEVKNGGKFSKRGFGTFSLVETKPRKGKNFSTGAVNIIPAKNRCKFTQSESLKEKLNIK